MDQVQILIWSLEALREKEKKQQKTFFFYFLCVLILCMHVGS